MSSSSNIIVINSRDRINPFDLSTRYSVKVNPSFHAKSVTLDYAIIPNNTYNITSNNNLLSFDDAAT